MDHVEKLVTVIAPGKESVFDYTRGAMEGLATVEPVYFNDKYVEWPGSIRSAETHFTERNIALLPDSVIETASASGLLQQFTDAFDDGADLVFAYVAETDRKRLSALGALEVQDGRVVAFCDKPREDQEAAFNGFWASFGFISSCAEPVLDFMMASVARETVDIGSLGLKIHAFEVDRYTDLGTWPSIAQHLATKVVLD